MSKPIISLRGVCKTFDGRKVLDGVDLDIMREQSTVVIGMSGSGKSVLLKCILGLEKPDAGEITVDGKDWLSLSTEQQLEHMHRVGMLFQGAALFDSLPVWENVAFALLQQGESAAAARKRASEVLAWVGLPDVENKMPAELSGGMVKRVGLARAICHKPSIIFFDEPTTGLDPMMADVINRLIVQLKTESRITAVSITHDMKSARMIGDTIAMLYQGRIHRQISPMQIDSDQDPILRQFIDGLAEGPIPLNGGMASTEGMTV
jgi:phospholipid/cholesterol/gamma-HCH transport system ATP-binding protein